MRVRLRWTAEVGAARSAVFDLGDAGDGDTADVPMQVEVAEVAAWLRKLPPRPLVVIGKQGAGKSASVPRLRSVDKIVRGI